MANVRSSSVGSNDFPISNVADDLLGFDVYVEALGDFILTCETPMTVAIQGDWGSGKTSLMNLIRKHLLEPAEKSDLPRKKIKCIWINTWRFSQFDMGSELPFSVISLFSRELTQDESLASDVLRTLRELSLRRVAKATATGATLLTTALVAGRGSAEALANSFGGDAGLDVSQRIADMRDNLQKLVIDARAKENVDRFVVFIDDIDRLVPERAVEMLEALKVFLELDGCVFVLACDYHVISRGLRVKFGADSNDLKGKRFFDKIIQLPFSMPVGQMEVSDYLRNRLRTCGVELPEDDGNAISVYEGLLAHSVGFNPRGLKRLTNCLQVLRLVAERKGILADAQREGSKSERERALFAALCLQTAFEPLYMALMEVASWEHIDFQDLINLLQPATAPLITKSAEGSSRLEVRIEIAIRDCEQERTGAAQAIPWFFQALSRAIQIEGGDNECIEPNEIAMFISMLRFSSITATNVALSEQAGRADLSKVRPLLVTLRERLRKELQVSTTAYDGAMEAWIAPIIKGLGFHPWIGVDREGALMFSADIATEDQSKIQEARRRAIDWCVEGLEKLTLPGNVKTKRANADYGLVTAVLQAPSFSSRSVDEMAEIIEARVSDIYIPLVKLLQKKLRE